jgi:hypothetical protein
MRNVIIKLLREITIVILASSETCMYSVTHLVEVQQTPTIQVLSCMV